MGEVIYLKCPLCNMNRPKRHRKVRPGGVVVDDVEQHFHFYGDTEVVQVREGGGRGSGFTLLEGRGVRINDLARSDPEVFENLLSETRRLLGALEDARRG